MDGMFDAGSPRMDDTPAAFGEQSLSAEGSQQAPPMRCVSADPVFNIESPLAQSTSALELRRKRDLQSDLHTRLSQSTSNLPYTRDGQAEHVPSILPRVNSSTQPDLWLLSPNTVLIRLIGPF